MYMYTTKQGDANFGCLTYSYFTYQLQVPQHGYYGQRGRLAN